MVVWHHGLIFSCRRGDCAQPKCSPTIPAHVGGVMEAVVEVEGGVAVVEYKLVMKKKKE